MNSCKKKNKDVIIFCENVLKLNLNNKNNTVKFSGKTFFLERKDFKIIEIPNQIITVNNY